MNKLKNTLFILIPSLLILMGLIFYIQSFEVYSDEWGTDISFDTDYLVFIICGIALLIISINQITSNNKNVYYGGSITIGALLGFYNLGSFFKGLFKAMSKNANFDFMSNQQYLYIGIIGIVIFIYFVISYIDYKKN